MEVSGFGFRDLMLYLCKFRGVSKTKLFYSISVEATDAQWTFCDADRRLKSGQTRRYNYCVNELRGNPFRQKASSF
jgi:hypothetical protein